MRHYFRLRESENAFVYQEAQVGTMVHKALELHPHDWSKALEYTTQQLKVLGIEKKGWDRAIACLDIFYNELEIHTLFSEEDLVEYRFKEKISDDIYLVGKMDRIIPSLHAIYDWKTGSDRKKNISNDIQCIIYYKMYQRIFHASPKVFLVYLGTGEVIQFYPKQEYIDELFNGIIPKMVHQIKSNSYYKEGFFNGGCWRCSYREMCIPNT